MLLVHLKHSLRVSVGERGSETDELGDNEVDAAFAGERQRALLKDLVHASLSSVLHRYDHLLGEEHSVAVRTREPEAVRSIAPPGPLTTLPGIIKFAKSPFTVKGQKTVDSQVSCSISISCNPDEGDKNIDRAWKWRMETD